MANKLEFMFKMAGVDQAAQQLKRLDAIATQLEGRKPGANISDWLKASGGNFSASTIALNKQFFDALGQQSGKSMIRGVEKALKTPPVIPPPVLSKGIDFQKLGLGILAAPFSQWIGARGIAGSGLFGGGGGGSGGGGGLFGGGGFIGFEKAFVALKVVTEGLRVAFQELKEAVKSGSKLFTDAARVGRATTALSHLQATLGQIGISPDQAEQMMLSGQFPQVTRAGMGRFQQPSRVTGRQTVTQVGGIPLGATGLLGRGEMQQITNLTEEMKRAWHDSALNALQMGSSAHELYEVQYSINNLTREWKTLWQQTAAAIGPLIRDTMQQMSKVMTIINLQLQSWVNMMQKLHLISSGDVDFKQTMQGTTRMPGNEFTRMGFVMKGQPDQQVFFLRQIARYTERTNSILSRLFGINDPTGLGISRTVMTNLP